MHNFLETQLMRPWLSLTTFFLSDQNRDWAGNMLFQEIFYYLQLCNCVRVILVVRTHSRRIIFSPLDDWVKDRGGECFSTLAKQCAIFSPNILHRRLLSPGNNTGETCWKHSLSWHSLALNLCVINWELNVSEFQCLRFSAHSIYWILPSVCSGARFLKVLVTFQARSQIFESKSKE